MELSRTRAALLDGSRDTFEPFRAMVDEHTALGHELLELHEEYLVMCRQDLSEADHRAQTADVLRRELEILAQAAPLRHALLRRLLGAQLGVDTAGEA